MVAKPYVKQIIVAFFFNTKYGLNVNRKTINKIWQNRKKWLAVFSNLQISNTFKQRSV